MAEECDTTKRVIIKHASFPERGMFAVEKSTFIVLRHTEWKPGRDTLPLHQESQQDTGSNC